MIETEVRPRVHADTLDGVDEIETSPQSDLGEMSGFEASIGNGWIIQIEGGGANTQHFAEALRQLRAEGYFIQLFDRNPVDSEKVPHDEFLQVNDPEHARPGDEERQAKIERAMAQRALVAYISLPPDAHVEAILRHLERVGKGVLRAVVVTKPAVKNLEEMLVVDAKLKQVAEMQRERLGDVEPADALYVHEHYLKKRSLVEMLMKLPQASALFGRLKSVSIDIQEARSVEDEGRNNAVGDGVFDDLFPHMASIGMAIQDVINESGLWNIPNVSKYSTDMYRYKGSTLPEGAATGFSVECMSTISDVGDEENVHDLLFRLDGGKALFDRKMVTFEFEHPDEPHTITTITVDLQSNTIVGVPREHASLFPQREFDDNGYGRVVYEGLSGKLDASFQKWRDTRKVVKLMHFIKKQHSGVPILYDRVEGGRTLKAVKEMPLVA